MEYVILGLLLMRDLTQYDIKRALEVKPSPFFSASMGSIQAALKKLLEKGYIQIKDQESQGRRKKIYSICDSGRNRFKDWMLENIDNYHFDQIMVTKLFFLGLLSKAERIQFIKIVMNRLDGFISSFESVGENNYQGNDLAYYQFKTLDLGLLNYQQTRKFFQEMLNELEGE